MTNEIEISLDSEPQMATVYLTEHAILAGLKPFIGFHSSVTVQIDENEKAWNPDGGWFTGPDTVSYIKNTVTGVTRARVSAELFE